MDKKLQQILKFSSYKEKVYEEIKTAILNNVFEPGATLNERAIAESLGVSRTPVREALKLLEYEGWVTSVPWKGIYVSSLKETDVEEVIQLRKALETTVIDLLPLNISPQDIENLKTIIYNMRKHYENCQKPEFMNKDKAFHLYLAKLGGNSRLNQILDNLSDQIHRLGLQAILPEGRMLESINEHNAIMEAICSNDPEMAKKQVELHLEYTRKAILAALTNK